MRRVAVTAAIAAAFFLSVRASGRDQAPPDKEKSFTSSAEVALVEVPVHVTGKDGLPVRDLTKDDFELFDDGKRVAIEQVDRTDLEDFSKGLPTTPDMPIPVAARRYFFLLFDMSFSR